MKWTFDLSTGLFVSFVHFQIDVRSGSEILTGSVNRSFIGKSAYVFVHHVWRNRSGSLVQTPEDLLQIKLWIESNHVFRKRIGLNQKEPPHIFGSKLLVRSLVQCEGRRDVHTASLLNSLGVIETEPVPCASTTIVSHDHESARDHNGASHQ